MPPLVLPEAPLLDWPDVPDEPLLLVSPEMPPLVIVPVDDAGSQLEPLRFRLHEDVVQPGQNIKFQKSFDNWPSTAPNFVLGVADAP